mmetsp:Transcript_14980/g.20318  ORF Transcript_14980/g.20318 Transcript_14980/m.20318 type:complete len:91 (+) Transcript_14980:98-370(+)
MDFVGQECVKNYSWYVQIVTSIVAYLIGWYMQRLEVTVFIILGISALMILLTMPAWPLFRQNKLKWLDTAKLEEYVRQHGKREKKGNSKH